MMVLFVLQYLFPGNHLSSLNRFLIPSTSVCAVRISSGAFPSSLHLLDLSHNNITAIEGLKDLCRLRVLNLSHNRVTRIGHGKNCKPLNSSHPFAPMNMTSTTHAISTLLELLIGLLSSITTRAQHNSMEVYSCWHFACSSS